MANGIEDLMNIRTTGGTQNVPPGPPMGGPPQPQPQPQPQPEPTPEPVADPDTIRYPRVSVFPSTIEQPSFLDDVPVMTFEREPGKATFVHDKNKQLSLFE